MEKQLRVLIVDDQKTDAALTARQIAMGGYKCEWRRVANESDFRTGLRDFHPDLILSDFSMPDFDGLVALNVASSEAPHVPFIFVSGTLGEERALQALKNGATDYVPKNDLTRLVPAVTRALGETVTTQAMQSPTERIRRLTSTLQMLSGLRAAAIGNHSRTALLEEVCRVIDATQQYQFGFVALLNTNTRVAHTVAWTGIGAGRSGESQFPVGLTVTDDTSVTGRVLRTGTAVCLPALADYTGQVCEHERHAAFGAGSICFVPLLIGTEPVGVFAVGAARHGYISRHEVHLLKEFAAQLGFVLQALPEDNTARHLSPLDPLTSLPRRELFSEQLAHQLTRRILPGQAPAVIVFDIERLRDINAAHGRYVGDRLIQCVGERLKRRFGGADALGHFGGGTFAAFALLRSERARQSQAHDYTTAIFGQPFAIGGTRVPVLVKCGVAYYPANGSDAETLLQHAESALVKLRERGESRPHLRGAAAHDLTPIEDRLRVALEKEQFLLNYQPLIERHTGHLVGVEALLRWRDPEQGLVPPGVFIPILESTALIVPVGEWVLAQAAKDWGRWRSMNLPRIRIALNVSPTELAGKDFAPQFLDIARQHAGGRCDVDVEITESVLLEGPRIVTRNLQVLREHGVRVAIDDFGMAYSSLARLSELPVDTIKIDRSFINRLGAEPQSQAVVATIIALARTCQLDTIAEGVETMEQLDILNALGCDHTQGHLHSPPLTAEELELLLAAYPAQASA